MACPHRITYPRLNDNKTCTFWTKNTGQELIDKDHDRNFCKYNDVNNSRKCPYFFLRNFDVK